MAGGGRDAENPFINELLGSLADPAGIFPGPPPRAPEGKISGQKTISSKRGSQAGKTVGVRKRRKTSVRSAPRTRLL